jgi:TonB family protein
MKRCLSALLLLTIISSISSLTAAQAVPQRVRVSSGVASGLVETKVAPVYPPLARQARIQGVVILQVLISTTGDVEKADLISGHPMLATAAIEAVKQWKYKPYLLNGEPIEVETQVQVNFSLSDKPTGDANTQETSTAGTASSTGSTEPVPPASNMPKRIRVSKGVMQGMLLKKVNPEYPPEAKDQQIQGVVMLQVMIDGEGSVADVKLISGHPLLAPAAIDAVKRWRYRPYLLNGEPLMVDTQVQVNFTLAQ